MDDIDPAKTCLCAASFAELSANCVRRPQAGDEEDEWIRDEPVAPAPAAKADGASPVSPLSPLSPLAPQGGACSSPGGGECSRAGGAAGAGAPR